MKGIAEMGVCDKCGEQKAVFDICRAGIFYLCGDCFNKWRKFLRKTPYKEEINRAYRTRGFVKVWIRYFDLFLEAKEEVEFT